MAMLNQKRGKGTYVNIPVELCEYVIRNNFYRPMQLYVYLKTHCSGTIKIDTTDLEKIGNAIGLSSHRAVKNNLKSLLIKNWIGYNKKTKNYFIRGFERIRQLHNFKTRTAAEFDGREIKKMKAFIIAAKIGYLLNIQKRKKRATERNKGRSLQVACRSSDYYPLANLALTKLLNISLSTAHKLKQLARKSGYIRIIKTFEKTSLDAYNEKLLKKAVPELAPTVKTKKGKVIFQGVDMVAHNLIFRKRKKLETY